MYTSSIIEDIGFLVENLPLLVTGVVVEQGYVENNSSLEVTLALAELHDTVLWRGAGKHSVYPHIIEHLEDVYRELRKVQKAGSGSLDEELLDNLKQPLRSVNSLQESFGDSLLRQVVGKTLAILEGLDESGSSSAIRDSAAHSDATSDDSSQDVD